MTITADQLAAKLAPPAATVKPWCRGSGCGEHLDPVLVDRPEDNSGLHSLCTEILAPAIMAGPTITPCRDPWCGGKCGYTVDQHVAAWGPSVLIQAKAPVPQPVPPTAPKPATFAAPASKTGTDHPFKRELIDMIRWTDANSPRSLQTTVGPSEIGVDCLRRLAYKVTGTPEVNDTADPWFAIIGTAVHDWLAYAIDAYQTTKLGRTGDNRRFLIEQRVRLADDEHGVSGSCDLFDRDEARVVDHKVVGNDNLRKYRDGGPSSVYRTQVHLYGYGWVRAGFDVREVAIAFYPRSNYLDTLHVWTEPYDQQIALAALSRLASVQQMTAVLPPSHIPAVPDKTGCVWCPYYRPGGPADKTGCPGPLTS